MGKQSYGTWQRSTQKVGLGDLERTECQTAHDSGSVLAKPGRLDGWAVHGVDAATDEAARNGVRKRAGNRYRSQTKMSARLGGVDKCTQTKRGKIIMMMDANQTVHAETRSYSLKQAMRNCHLQSAMEEAYPGKTLQSVDHGSHTINHILTAGINQALIRKVGQLPFGIGFSSDHRAIFADFSA